MRNVNFITSGNLIFNYINRSLIIKKKNMFDVNATNVEWIYLLKIFQLELVNRKPW